MLGQKRGVRVERPRWRLSTKLHGLDHLGTFLFIGAVAHLFTLSFPALILSLTPHPCFMSACLNIADLDIRNHHHFSIRTAS